MDKRMLIIEDNELLQNTMQMFFEEKGYSVAVASNGIEGLNKIREVEPDIVLMDNHMPEMTGLDVLRSLNSSDAKRVIMMSAGDPIETFLESQQLGAADFVHKPFEFRFMERVVLMHINRSD